MSAENGIPRLEHQDNDVVRFPSKDSAMCASREWAVAARDAHPELIGTACWGVRPAVAERNDPLQDEWVFLHPKIYTFGQRFDFKPGDRVFCNGYPGAIARIYDEHMVEVRLPGGLTCVSAAYPSVYPQTPGKPSPVKPTDPVSLAIAALELAIEGAGESNASRFRAALNGLTRMRYRVVRYNQNLDDREIAPTGDSYNDLLSITGLALSAVEREVILRAGDVTA